MSLNFLSDDCPSYSSIVAKIAKGDLWLDDNNAPTIAVAYSYCVGGFGILRDIKESKTNLKNFLETKVFPELKKEDKRVFEFSTEDNKIEVEMLISFSDKKIKSELEYSYRLETKITKEFSLCNSYKIVQVNKSILDNIEKYNNYELLTKRIKNSWYTNEDFLNKSMAYIALYEDNIAGVCFGSAFYNGYIAVDIETNKKHRRKGIAANLAKYFTNTAISRNYIVQWDRIDSNVASKLLAEKCGFELFKVRPYYWFRI